MNQQLFYSLFQPKLPNDKGLIKIWTNKLLENNVKILVNSQVIKIDVENNNVSKLIIIENGVRKEIIANKINGLDRSLRFWSAGCSRGAEPYSIAIALMEKCPAYEEWNISVLGTDINRSAYAFAQKGIFSARDLKHLPQEYLKKYQRK